MSSGAHLHPGGPITWCDTRYLHLRALLIPISPTIFSLLETACLGSSAWQFFPHTFLGTAEPSQSIPACQAALHMEGKELPRKMWGLRLEPAWVYYYSFWCIHWIMFAISTLFSFLALGWLVTRLAGITSNYTIFKISLHSWSTGKCFSKTWWD